MKPLHPIFFVCETDVWNQRKSIFRYLNPRTLFTLPTGIFKLGIFRSLLLLSITLMISQYDVAAQTPGSPCNAHRWQNGAHWTGSGCGVNDNSNAPGPLGIVRCGNAADTESGVDVNTTYDPAVFAIVPSMCEDPNTGLPVTVTAPFDGQKISWFNFDVRPYAGVYDFQTIATGNYDLGWALYYSLQDTCGVGTNGLSGECAVLSGVIACGTGFTGWSPQPYLTPIFNLPTNLYLVVWKTGATDASNDVFDFTFKARYGCGDFCSLMFDGDPIVTCNPNGTYQVVQQVNGTNTNVTVTAPGSLSIVTTPTPLTLTTAAAIPNINYGTITVTYPAGVNYNITYTPSGDGVFCLPLNRSAWAPICCVPPPCSIDGPDAVCPGASVVYCAPAGANGYSWTISGNGVISGATNQQCVTVTSSNTCNTNFTVSLTVGSGTCTSICSNLVTINDVTPPAITCPTVVSPIECGTAPDFGIATATDACDSNVEISFVSTTLAGSCGQEYSVTRIWTATDACGNTAQCSATIFIQDTTPPLLTCPMVVSPVQCGSNLNFGDPMTLDACDVSVSLTYSDLIIPGLCPHDYIITRTWIAEDDCGNSTSHSSTIVVYDSIPPVITCPTVISPISCGTTPSFGTPTAIDACGGFVDVTFSDATVSGTCPQDLDITRTWIAMDVCGNTSSCSVTISIQDNTPPVITCPIIISPINCGSIPDFGIATAIDGCDASVTITFTDATSQGSCAGTYSVTRTWIASDVCGNSTTCSSTIVVQDLTPPTISCTSQVSPIACPALPVFTAPTAIDLCDASVAITFSDETTQGSCAGSYSVTRTWTASDDCGNTATCSGTIVVRDLTAPTIACTSQVSPIVCPAVPVFTAPTAIDLCDASVAITFTDATSQGSCAGSYSVTRTWTASDDCGNTATCSGTIVVRDLTAPTLTCAAQTSPINCPAVPVFTAPTAIDLCDASVAITFSDATTQGSCAGSYSVTRTWTASDVCGNTATCSGTIVVRDLTAPTIACPVLVSPIECGSTPVFGLATATDACDSNVELSFVTITTAGSCGQEYSQTRTWTATDNCGNTATCSGTIVVQDLTPPTISCTSQVSPIACPAVPVFTAPTAIDLCDASVAISFTDATTQGSCAGSYSVTRTWTASDDCGNTTTCSGTIVVGDITAPIITCPVVVSPILCGEPLDFGIATATDACDALVTITFADVTVPGACPQGASVTRTWTATDDCGNTSSCSSTIVIDENTALLIECPEPITVQCADEVPAVDVTLIEATGNCGPMTVTHGGDVISNQTCDNSLTITRTYVIADTCGTTSCIQIITVRDTTPPELVFTNPALGHIGDTLRVQCFGQDPLWDIPTYGVESILATDNCVEDVIITYDVSLVDEGDCSADGYINLYRLEWTATDACGNSSNAYLFLSLVDTIPPVIEGIPEDITVSCENIPALPTVYATDECLCACVILLEETDRDLTVCQDGLVITRTWTAKDRCGNETVETQRITLIDEEGPVMHLTQPELKEYVNGSILEYSCNEGGLPEYFDTLRAESVFNPLTCGGISSITFDREIDRSTHCEFDGFLEQQTFIWNAIDACGNKSALSVIVRLVDTEAPVFLNVPELGCLSNAVNDTIEAFDNCGQASVRFWDVDVANPCGAGTAVLRTYEAYDECGNMARDTTYLIPDDLGEPTMVFVDSLMQQMLPGEIITLDCANSGLPYTVFGPQDVVITDACALGVTVSFNEHFISAGDCIVDGNVAVIGLQWIATDLCGNFSEHTIQANIIDETSPVFENFKPEITIRCNDSIPEYLVTDGCGVVTVTTDDVRVEGECPNEYTIQRRITAQDPCGNRTIKDQIIHVGDGSGPIIIGVDTLLCNDLSIPHVTAYDACAGVFVAVSMEQDTLEDLCREGLVIGRTWQATDACGNVREVNQTIILNDHTAPELQIPSYSVIQQFLDNASNLIYLSQTDLIRKLNTLNANSVFVKDECDTRIEIVFDSVVIHAENCLLQGFSERRTYTWTATDVCGNSTSISFTVDIMDDVSPEMPEIPGDTLIVCAPLPIAVPLVSLDTNDIDVITYTEVIKPGQTVGEFTVVRTWVATDHCENTSTDVQIITWIPDSYLECAIILPDVVECNSHGIVISSDVRGGTAPYTYEWQIVGEKCFIQGGQNTPEIEIYIGWADVKIILTVTDSFGCVSMCMVTLDCLDGNAVPVSNSFDADTYQETPEGEKVLVNPFEANGELKNDLEQLSFWPNPADEVIHIAFESEIDGVVNFLFTDYLGKVIQQESIMVHKGYNVQQIDASGLANGSYLVQVQSEKAKYTRGVIILHME